MPACPTKFLAQIANDFELGEPGAQRTTSLCNLRLAVGSKRLPVAALPQLRNRLVSHAASTALFGAPMAPREGPSQEVLRHLPACTKLWLIRWQQSPSFGADVHQGATTVADSLANMLQRARKVVQLEVDLFGSAEIPEENGEAFIDASAEHARRVLAACGAMPALDSLLLRGWDYLDGPALAALDGHRFLKVLHPVECRGIIELGDELWRLPNLKTVVVSDSDLQEISFAGGQARQLRSLTIDGENGVTFFPDALFALPNFRFLAANHASLNLYNARTVESLSLRSFAGGQLPTGLNNLFTCLKELDLRATNLGQLPDYLLHMVQLERLVVDEHLLPNLLPGFRAWQAQGILVTA